MTLEDTIKTVAVHSGNFHSDDVFAVAALKFLYPDLEVIRTRDNNVMNSADVRIDVGFTYDHAKKTYDHHQKGGAGNRENGIPYSSFGLIWKHYGKSICDSEDIARNIDEIIVQKIDGIDAGYFKPRKDDSERDFYLSSAIGYFNPNWQEDHPDHDTAFNKAVDFAYDILKGMLIEEKGKIVARNLVIEAINKKKDEQYIVLNSKCPWEETAVKESDVLYVIYGEKDRWMIGAVPKKVGLYELRKPFPESWAGASTEDLRTITGVEDVIFCHTNRFAASAKSLEGAKRLAEIASRS